MCDDFVFNQFLDAAIALHSTRAKARRARFTSSLSAYDPPVCVEYDAALPMSVAAASATGQLTHNGSGGGGGSLSTAVLSSNSKSGKMSVLKNGKQMSSSPSSSSSLTTSPTNTTTTTTTVVKKPRRLFTHDAQWASTDAEVRSIATYATPFSMVKAVRGPVGLFNLGNSCYMNSVLQAFLNAPPLRNFFLADLHGTSCKLRHSPNNNNNNNNHNNNNNTSNNNYSNHSNNNQSSSYHLQCFACAIERLVCDSCFVLEARAFAREKGGPVSFLPVPFLVPHTVLDIIWRNFSHLATYAQHDAHEFFMAALNLLSEHCRRDPASSSTSSTAAPAVLPTSSSSTVVKKEKNEPVLVELKLRKSSHHLNNSNNNNNNNNNDMDIDTDRDTTANKAAGVASGDYQAAAAAGASDGGAGGTKKSQLQPPATTSIVQSLFSGTLQSDVICRVCGNSSSKLEKFSDIQLHVDKPGRAVTVSRRGRSASSGGGGDNGSGNGMSGSGRSHGGGSTGSGRNRYEGKNRSSWSSSAGDMDPSNGHSDNTGDHHHNNNNNHHHHHHNSGYGNQHTNGKDYNNNNSHNHNNNNNSNNSYSNNNSNNHNNHCNPNGKDYTNSLRECLNRYTEPELLGVGDEMFCSSCNCKQEAMKQMSIRTLPPIVCFHFKRFKQSANIRRSEMVKIDTAVEFPVDGLDLSPFQTAEILHRRQQHQQQQNDPSVNNKNRLSKDSGGINPNTSDTGTTPATTGSGSLKKSNKANNHNNNNNNNKVNQFQQHQYANSVGKKRSFAHMDVRENDQAIYDLFAVVNHVGKIDSGHYTALVRREGAWYRCDDEKITQVKDIQKVVRSVEAYLVFYVQRCVNLQFSESHL